MSPKKRKDSSLPPYVYRTRYGYVWKPYLGTGVARPTKTIASKTATISQVWAAWERINRADDHGTLGWLLREYTNSEQFNRKASATQKEQSRQAEHITKYERGRGQTFGSATLSHITPGVMTRYLDARESEGAPKAGNRELALMSAAWNWALARDLTTAPNPCRAAEKRPEARRQHYATDRDYLAWLDYCRRHGPRYLWIVSELCYLCRMRKVEVLTAKKSQVMDEGFDTLRRKGSRHGMTGWSERLRAAVDACSEDEAGRFSSYLVTHRGQPIRITTFNTMWQRRMKACVAETGITRFTTHDLKRKGATDSDEDATVSTGNSAAMSRVYDVSKLKAKPTK